MNDYKTEQYDEHSKWNIDEKKKWRKGTNPSPKILLILLELLCYLTHAIDE